MRKFIIQYSKQGTFIMEVEVEKILGLEDLSVMFLPPGEFKGRILKPESLYEKDKFGKLISPIWACHVFFDDVDSAMNHLRKNTKFGFFKSKAVEANKLGLDLEINEEEMKLKTEEILSEVKVIYL
jgi:hypothetical protein